MTRRLAASIAALLACLFLGCGVPAGLEDGTRRSSPLYGLRLAQERPVGESVPEPSDLAYDPSAGTFWTVSDQNGTVCLVAPDGAVAGEPIRVRAADLEGVTLDPKSGHLVVVDEATSSAIEVTREGQEVRRFDVPVRANNAGLEGIAYDPVTNGFVIAHERNPAELVFVDGAGTVTSRVPVQTEDISAVTLSPDGQSIFVAARFEEAVLELDRAGRRTGRFALNEPAVEGLAFDDRGRLFAIADLGAKSRGMLYMYVREGNR